MERSREARMPRSLGLAVVRSWSSIRVAAVPSSRSVTVATSTAVKLGLTTYDPDVVRGSTLDRNELDRQIELYRTRGDDERRSIVGLQAERADIILAGACIVRTVIAKLGVESFTVSDRGLRHGLLVDRFG